jgi:hypothetical protein
MRNQLLQLINKVFNCNNSVNTPNIVAKNKVLVGKIDGQDAYITFFYKSEKNNLVFSVCYNECITACGRKVNNFNYIDEEDIAAGVIERKEYNNETGESGPLKKIKIEFFENYQEILFEEVSKQESIELSIRIHAMAEKLNKMRAELSKGKSAGLEYMKLNSEYTYIFELYMNGINNELLLNEFHKYNSMTEESYEIWKKEQEKIADRFFKMMEEED